MLCRDRGEEGKLLDPGEVFSRGYPGPTDGTYYKSGLSEVAPPQEGFTGEQEIFSESSTVPDD